MFRFGFNLLLSINILYSFTVGSLLRFIPTPKISIIQACDKKGYLLGILPQNEIMRFYQFQGGSLLGE